MNALVDQYVGVPRSDAFVVGLGIVFLHAECSTEALFFEHLFGELNFVDGGVVETVPFVCMMRASVADERIVMAGIRLARMNDDADQFVVDG